MIDNATILSNVSIAKDIWKMELKTELYKEAKPGQFINIKIPGFYLRRPISISEIKDDGLVIIYKVLGEGTEELTHFEKGEILDVFGPLGNGFELEDTDSVILIGGGVGVPPLYELAKRFVAKNVHVDVVLGFNDASQIFYENEFKEIGANVYIATMDGSYGVKGTVIDAIEKNGINTDMIYTCGPTPMLRALNQKYTKGYVSLEARMACGLGACMGCVVKDREGHSLRVCKDGPVFPVGKVEI